MSSRKRSSTGSSSRPKRSRVDPRAMSRTRVDRRQDAQIAQIRSRLAVSSDVKAVTQTVTDNLFDSANAHTTYVSGLAQGVQSSERIGAEVSFFGAQLAFHLVNNAGPPSAPIYVRLLLLRRASNNLAGASLKYSDVFEAAPPAAYQLQPFQPKKRSVRKNVDLLFDKVIMLPGSSSGLTHQSFKTFVRLPKVKSTFSLSTAVEAQISTNQYYVMAVNDQNSSVTKLTYSATLYYTG